MVVTRAQAVPAEKAAQERCIALDGLVCNIRPEAEIEIGGSRRERSRSPLSRRWAAGVLAQKERASSSQDGLVEREVPLGGYIARFLLDRAPVRADPSRGSSSQ